MDRPHNLMVVNSVVVLEAAPERAALERLLAERLTERFPRFRQRVVETGPLRRPAFADCDFRISDHLVDVRLPAPGGERELQEYVGAQVSVPLPRDEPLWQLQLVEGYQGGAALISRMHHCIADGIALARVLLTLTDAPEAVEIADDTPGPSVRDLGHDAFELFAHPSRLAAIAATTPKVGATLTKELLSTRGARTGFTGTIGATKHVAWSRPVPLEALKAAARPLGVTLNDLVVAAISGALRHHTEDGGGAVHDLRMIVPFNLRALTQPLPRDLGNRFGLVYLSLPLTVSDPVARVAETHRRMQAIKDSPEPAVSYGVLQGVGRTTAGVERRLIDFFASKAVGVVTNVCGPDHGLTLAGVPIRRIIPFVPVSGDQTIGISIFSHAGELSVGIVTDAFVVPRPDRIIDAYLDEVGELVGSGAVHGASSEGGSRARG
jgi:WS/DGAT/MGAT family acyltransferase